ncbi:hypothetical protein J2X03_003803 [Microbacterium trichothecenolyticum]|uniref:hypothetical protein n=1 Tax=Microbacterium trichothecenolyticum TaxID=69370 RepID=UPI002861F60E|nr:hypothetical protein [Microbacterium trichothecenolyticum]MDR7113901.1 hypothetical protein [Microbacterium trichothecenolyticum]
MEYEIEATMPRLVIPAPECGHCGEVVEYDDGAMWCGGCRVMWEQIEDGALSIPDPDREGTAVPCTIAPPAIDSGTGWSLVHGPCILPSGHEGEHECPMSRVPNGGDA